MPIRFRCAYCNQLMGIARRKAGTVVRCPTCSGQVVVPAAEANTAPVDSSDPHKRAPVLFERQDFDQLFGPATGEPRQEKAPPAPNRAPAPDAPDLQALALDVEVRPVPAPRYAPPPGILLTPLVAILGGVFLFILLIVVFLAGYFLGGGSF
jgi:phage FluMu protein Com